jgi:2-polyprenyl-3-methyl-5-hydroxy-6-metoxy-1,4-benzoquinol methylase
MGVLLEQRQVAEWMDAPGLDAGAHAAALAGLRRLNKASGAAEKMAREVIGWAREAGVKHLRMLDVACGGGDVPVEVARWLGDAGVTVALTLLDKSGTALALAGRAARRAEVAVRTVEGAAPDGLPEGEFEVVTSSLFLHHLGRGDVVATLREMGRRTSDGGCVVVSDLRRSWVGYAVAWVMCRVLSRSAMVHHDGPVSVRAAWTAAEMRAMAAEAGLAGATVRLCWPWRMLVVWIKTRKSKLKTRNAKLET